MSRHRAVLVDVALCCRVACFDRSPWLHLVMVLIRPFTMSDNHILFQSRCLQQRPELQIYIQICLLLARCWCEVIVPIETHTSSITYSDETCKLNG